MNRVFKTKWSAAHQQYVVTDEHHATKGKAAKSAVCKINIDSDSRLAMTAAVRKVFAEKPAEFDPRKYLGPARDEMERLYKHKIENVLGSAGKAE